MWLKLFGALLVVVSSVTIGFLAAWRYGERPRQIRQLISCLSALQSHIHFSAVPLSEALCHAADGIDGPVSRMFKDAGAMLRTNPSLTPEEAIRIAQIREKGRLVFATAEQELVKLFTANLGMMNREEQSKNLYLIQEQLENVAREAQTKRDANMKICRYLGVCSGMAIIIMLI